MSRNRGFENKPKDEINTLQSTVLEVEEKSIIVNVQGWRMRVYGRDLSNIGVGREVSINYTGDLKDIHSIKLIGLTK